MTNEHPKISIVVPVYNVEKYLPKCLDSLVNQTYGNVEIICVNDGSRDGSGRILDQYAEKYPQVKVVVQENAGLSGARNTGMDAASGDYLMFVDSDDWVSDSICSELMEQALQHNADSVMCTYCKEYEDHSVDVHVFSEEKIVWNGDEFKEKFYRRLFGLVGKETRHPENIDLIVSAWQQLFKREICEKVRFVDTKKIGTEDCLFQMEVYAKCKKFVYIDRPLYHYRKTNVSSLTAVYNPRLFARWQNLYDRMEGLIKTNHYPEIYWTALNNRFLFGLIGLGLNEITAGESIFWKSARLRHILKQPRYREAFENLDMSDMSLPWKIFFFLAKHKFTLELVVMLELIDFARKRVR